MEIDYPYKLSDQDARSRLDILSKYLAAKHGIQVTWAEPTKARFRGRYLVVKIEGELSLSNGHARFRGEDPGFLWRGKAKDYIKEKLAKYLDPENEAASLPTS